MTTRDVARFHHRFRCNRAIGLHDTPRHALGQLGQCIADVGELGLLAFALAIEPGLRVGGRSMGGVTARLAVEVTFAVAATRRRLVRTILGAEALH